MATGDERIDALAAAQARTEERLGELAERVTALAEQVGSLTEQVGALTEQVGALVSQVSKLGTKVDALGGDALERRYREFGFAYLRQIARRLRLLTGPDLDDLLETAVEQGRLDEDSSDQVRLADAVFRGRRRSDGIPCYVVLEASIGIGVGDVTRAGERAALLARSGTPAVAAVAGEWISREAAQAADDLGVWQVTNGRATPPGSVRTGPLGVVE